MRDTCNNISVVYYLVFSCVYYITCAGASNIAPSILKFETGLQFLFLSDKNRNIAPPISSCNIAPVVIYYRAFFYGYYIIVGAILLIKYAQNRCRKFVQLYYINFAQMYWLLYIGYEIMVLSERAEHINNHL